MGYLLLTIEMALLFGTVSCCYTCHMNKQQIQADYSNTSNPNLKCTVAPPKSIANWYFRHWFDQELDVPSDLDIPLEVITYNIEPFGTDNTESPGHNNPIVLLTILISPKHNQSHAYYQNGNYRILIAVVDTASTPFKVLSQTNVPHVLQWERDPHWKQALFDVQIYQTEQTIPFAVGVQLRAEYKYKMQTNWVQKEVLFAIQQSTVHHILDEELINCDCCPEGTDKDQYYCAATSTLYKTCPHYVTHYEFQVANTATGGTPDIIQSDQIDDKDIIYKWNGNSYEPNDKSTEYRQ